MGPGLNRPDLALGADRCFGGRLRLCGRPLRHHPRPQAGYFRGAACEVSIEKSGYKPVRVAISPSINGWGFGNISIGGLIGMLLVDPFTGAMDTLRPDAMAPELEAEGAKVSSGEGTLLIRLVQDVPSALLAKATSIGHAQHPSVPRSTAR